MKKLFLLQCFVYCLFIGCRISNGKSASQEYDIISPVDSIFSITLHSNPSTGYTWKWINKEEVKSVDSADYSFVSSNPELVGSGGQEIWMFRGRTKGQDTLKFEYNRSFEKNSTVKTKAVSVKIE